MEKKRKKNVYCSFTKRAFVDYLNTYKFSRSRYTLPRLINFIYIFFYQKRTTDRWIDGYNIVIVYRRAIEIKQY